MDDEILKTVESMLGKNVKIVDCEKTSTTREEEVLLINGIPITIEGADSVAIKNALITGEVPSCELLNQLLFRAGILRQPVHLETSLSVKSTLVTKEEVTVARGGCILDEKSTETKEDTFYTSSCKEIWEPIKMVTCLPPSIEASAGTTPENRPASAIPYRDPAFPIDSNGDLHTVSSANSTYLSSQPNSTTSICDSLSDCCDKLRHRKSVEENCRKPLQQQADKLPDPQHQQQSHSHQQKQPNASYDSGNDDVFSSQLLDTPNSISSGFELSLDETDFLKTDSTTIPVFIKRKPQQSIEQPSQQQHSMSVTSNIQQMNVLKKKQITKNSDSSCSSTSSSDVLHTGGDTMNSDIGDINDSSKNGGDFDENVLVYRDSSLISGSLSALIQHMVPTSTYYPDRSYIFAFLLSARLFIRPQELLEKIGQISDEQQHLDTCNIDAMSCNFVQRLIQVLAEWMTTFPYDFRDERIMISIRKLTRKCQQIDKKLEDTIARMLQNLSKILEELNQYEQFLENINQRIDFLDDRHDSYTGSSTGSSNSVSQQHNYHPHHNHHQQQQQQQQQQHHHQQQQYSNNPPYPTSSDITDICSNPTQLAHQLTHIELERLSHIGPEEFVQAFVKDNPHIDPLMSDTKKTRNLESYVQWFNRLSYFVASEIVKHSKKKQRIRVIEYWIEAARECFNIGNFNSLMAIIAGLNMSPISRLKKTWAKVQSAKFLVLEHQMDPSSNFNSYRSTLKAAMWRSAGATDERERIVIPFFSLLVKDLYFLNEGCSNRLPNGYINFEKFWQLAKQVNEFIAWKQVTCPFPKLTKIATFLQTNLVLNENSLALASFECEPPDNNHEKDRYKSLKSEQNTLDKS